MTKRRRPKQRSRSLRVTIGKRMIESVILTRIYRLVKYGHKFFDRGSPRVVMKKRSNGFLIC